MISKLYTLVISYFKLEWSCFCLALKLPHLASKLLLKLSSVSNLGPEPPMYEAKLYATKDDVKLLASHGSPLRILLAYLEN